MGRGLSLRGAAALRGKLPTATRRARDTLPDARTRGTMATARAGEQEVRHPAGGANLHGHQWDAASAAPGSGGRSSADAAGGGGCARRRGGSLAMQGSARRMGVMTDVHRRFLQLLMTHGVLEERDVARLQKHCYKVHDSKCRCPVPGTPGAVWSVPRDIGVTPGHQPAHAPTWAFRSRTASRQPISLFSSK